jgi:predicted kinase
MVLLIGQPGSGKSTYIQDNPERFAGYTRIAIDTLVQSRVEELSREMGQPVSIDSLWNNPLERDTLHKKFYKQIKTAVTQGNNIIIDTTNLTPALRRNKIELARSSKWYDYRVVGVVIHPPEESDHATRLIKRAIRTNRWESINRVSVRPAKIILPKDGELDEVIEVGKPPASPLFHEYAKPDPDDGFLIRILQENHIPDNCSER